MNDSLDPRVNRLTLNKTDDPCKVEEGENWNVFEVFHQEKRGAHHEHVGCVHAPDPGLALVFAKEQFGRRGQTTSLWVVKSADILATDEEDSDIFETTPEKLHREASLYKTRDKIEAFKTETHE